MGMVVVLPVKVLTFHRDVKLLVSRAQGASEIRTEPEGVELIENNSQARWIEERLRLWSSCGAHETRVGSSV